jgi:hypothetical protein
MTATNDKYSQRANGFARACDIAIAIIRENPGIHSRDSFLRLTEQWKAMALNPEHKFRKLASLRYLEADFLIYWNESTGEHVDQFWRQIKEQNLDYARRNIISDVLKRKRIKNQIEYDSVIDNILIAQQSGAATQADTLILNQLIAEFETRKRKRFS